MSLTYGFYNSVNGDRKYNALQMSSLFDGIIRDGVFLSIGDALLVNATGGMTVSVGTGRAWFNHTWTNNDAILPLTVQASELILNRIDTVVLEVDGRDETRANSIKIVKGTPASSPVASAMANGPLVYQYALAEIYVGAGVTVITENKITNKIGTASTPFVSGVISAINAEALLTQWDTDYDIWRAELGVESGALLSDVNNQFQTLLTEKGNAADTQLTANDVRFENWFSSLIDILDENVAANLTTRVLALEGEIGTFTSESAQLTPTAQVLSVTDSTEGIADIEIGGETLYNAITNGDFANGITGWTGSGATLSVTNKVLNITGNGTSASTFVDKTINLDYVTSKKIFIKTRFRATNNSALSCSISLRGTVTAGTTASTTVNTPVQNQWYDSFAILTPTGGSGKYLFRLSANYADAATANGKVMAVDGNVGIFVIPITGTPYEAYTADQLNFMVNAYFEGFKGSNVLSIESKGRNLFDKNKAVNGYFYSNVGVLTASSTYSYVKIRLKPLTNYKFSGTSFLNFVHFDKNMNFISASTISDFTTPSNAYYTVASCLTSVLDTYMLNEGSTALPYEPFRGRTLAIGGLTRHRLPNNVQDWVMQKYGRTWAVRNVFSGADGKGYALQSGDIVTLNTSSYTNLDIVTTKTNIFADSAAWGHPIEGKVVTTFGPEIGNVAGIDSASNAWKFYTSTAMNIGFLVPKGTYANLAAAQTALAGTKILYQLATPKYIDYADFDANGIDFSGEVSTFEDYTQLAMTSADIAPEMLTEYPSSLIAGVRTIKETVTLQNEMIVDVRNGLFSGEVRIDLPNAPASEQVTYTNGVVTKITKFMLGVKRGETTYTYTNGVLTTKTDSIYANDGISIVEQTTDTYLYTSDVYQGKERVVNV